MKHTKKSLALLLSAAMLLSPFSNGLGKAQKTQAVDSSISNPGVENDIATWDTVYFGHFWQNDTNGDGTIDQTDQKEPIRWRVLSVEGNDAFLLADQCLDCQAYNYTMTEATWDNSTLRSWLNGYGSESNASGIDYRKNNFINAAFTQTEQTAIKQTAVINQDPVIIHNGKDTSDKIYLLSRTEVSNPSYGFIESANGTSNTRIAAVPSYIDEKYRDLFERYDKQEAYSWRLRTRGSFDPLAVDDTGYIAKRGKDDELSPFGVRPVLHLDLDHTEVYSSGETISSDGTQGKPIPIATPSSSPATPTDTPSVSPGILPSPSADRIPTASPSASPTASTNIVPTASADILPTASPNLVPNSTQSAAPTAKPTLKPSPTKAVTHFQDKKSNGEYKILASTKSGGTVTLQKPLKDSTKATIPATVKHDKKTYKVTNISSKAFYGKKKLKTVTIGKNVTTIGSKAFYSCTALKEIILPAKVKKIGASAFYNCRKMKELSIDTKKLTSKNIGSDAFFGIGNNNYKKLITDVPMSKLSAYTKLFRKKGMSAKSVIMPAGGNEDAYRSDPAPVELSKDFLELTVKKTDSKTSYGKATVKLKRTKGVRLKTVTCNIKKQGIVTASIKGESNPSIKAKAKKQGSAKIILPVRYQLGRKTKTEKLTLGIEVTLKDTRKKTAKNPSTPTVKKPAPTIAATPVPAATATPNPVVIVSPSPTAPAQVIVEKDEKEVAALYKIIGKQREIAASKGIRLDGIDNIDSDCYVWNAQGHLTSINWSKYELGGDISFSDWSNLTEIICGRGTISSLDVTGNAQLTKLICGDNKLAVLDIKQNTLLKYLDCHSNQITTLNVSQNILLEYLDCHDNKFASLNLMKNKQLTYLDCDERVTVIGYAYKATEPPAPTGTAATSPTEPPATGSSTTGSSTAVVSTDKEIAQALSKRGLKKLIIDNSTTQKMLTIPKGKYSNVDLVVRLPKGELENHGVFKSITIEQISPNTYFEKAIGNIIKVVCKKAHIEIDEDASVSIILPKENEDTAIENNGTIKKLEVNTTGKVEITGLSQEKISVEITAEVTISSTIKLDIDATSRFDINVRPGAEGTEITVDVEAHVPGIFGLGIISVKITATGAIKNIIGDNTGKEDELAKTVKVTGHVRNEGGEPIPGAEIYIARYTGSGYDVANIWTDKDAVRLTTDAEGAYSTDDKIKAGNYYLAARKEGYQDLTRQIVVITSTYGDTYTNEEITMIPKTWEGKTGSVTGKVLDSAEKDLALPDIAVRLRKGKASMDSEIEVIKETRTDSQGVYRFDDLEAGYYTIEFADDKTQQAGGEAYVTTWINVLIRPGETATEGAIMSKTLLDKQLRFVLSWGSKDSGAVADLDAHLTGPSGTNWYNGRFHTYFDNKTFDNNDDENHSKADLDVDDMDWEGPETTTIYEKIPGVYSYYVHNYTNWYSEDSAKLSESSVKVEVYNGNLKQNTYYIPQKKGTVWHVFDYDSSTNTFQTVNTMYYEKHESYVGHTVEDYKTSITSNLNFLKDYQESLEKGTGNDILTKATAYQERMDALTEKQDDKASELLREISQYRNNLEYECFPSYGSNIYSDSKYVIEGEMKIKINKTDYVPVSDDLYVNNNCTMTEVTPTKEDAWKAFRVEAANGHAKTIHVYWEYYTESISIKNITAGNTSLFYEFGNGYSSVYVYSSQGNDFQLEDVRMTFYGNPTSITHDSKKVDGEYTVSVQTGTEERTYIVRKMPVPEISDSDNTIHKTEISGNHLTVYADNKMLSKACVFSVNGKQYALERQKADPEYTCYRAYDSEHGFSWYIKCYEQDSAAGQ